MDTAHKTGTAGAAYEMDRRVKLIEEPDHRLTQISMSGDQRSPWHVHTEVEDLFYITEGVLRIRMHNPPETREIRAGESFSIQAGRPHFIEVADKKTVSFLLIQGLGRCDFKVLDPQEPPTCEGN
ncbi:cupin domain-containing protein [Xylophilus rhododendri]|uniref:Cupin domain-containing protein n=1 Tax=Xylophilus rhododendri TaxID=2697032 RepID=A0A857J582_9BURK|nr:cupin domain-containing protein [Xylophilus rhododendri]QHI99130.1 cupin domain-containing protein [Xylophilus rhododendri]